ncbi:hypothetical protein PS655_05940 [Pseudomonas fluorescens]|uniref:Uncharacterized protein n=1 Tax=Pseudomonas fluorescens TaxID=294 RepID=A0A5E6Y2T6_PSEFL|nr:hypothetical protein PS655_05940 [Pseudomonas fluorescens]
MGNLYTWLFGRGSSEQSARFEASDTPLPPTPNPDSAPLSAPAQPVDDGLQPVKSWSHPFKDTNNPLLQLTQLAKAKAGFYPIGINGLCRGGVHFDSGTAGVLDQSSVHCLADGEVVAYRIDEHSPKTTYFIETGTVQKPFSCNFVLVRHRLQPPKIEGSPDVPPSLTFYSLYMHLQDWAVYHDDAAIARPAFWPEGTTRRVKATVTDVHPDHSGQQGLNVRNQAHQGKVIGFLQHGTEVTASGDGHYRKLENTNGPDVLKEADGSLRGFTDRFGIDEIVFVALHERFNKQRGNHLGLMAHGCQLARYEMRTSAGFHHHGASG